MSRITRTGSVPLGHRADRQPGREPLAPPECREPDHLLQQWPPWAPSSSAARAPAAGTGPAGAPRTGSPAVATHGTEPIGSWWASSKHRPRRSGANRITDSGYPGRRAHQQPGRQPQAPVPAGAARAGSPAVATLGAELISSPGASRRHRPPPEHREPDHRQWPPMAPSRSAAGGPTAKYTDQGMSLRYAVIHATEEIKRMRRT